MKAGAVKRGFVQASIAALFAAVMLSSGCLADKRTLSLSGGDGGTGTDSGQRPIDTDSGEEPGETLPCDPVKQQGCLETRKCILDTSDKAVCTADGTRKTGQTCTQSPDSCLKGNLCAAGFCRQFCSKNADCTQPPPSGQPNNEPFCAFDVGSVKVCSTPCNPVIAAGVSGCIRGFACVYGNLGGTFLSDCNRVAGSGTNDIACVEDKDCADGYLCAGKKCRAYCRSGIDSDCGGGGYTCTPIATSAPFGVCCPSSGC